MELYLYHRVRENMIGTTLYPLHQLRVLYPAIYDEAVKKYVGREWLLEQRIPYFDCLWNDVIFLAAINPRIVSNEVARPGYRPLDFSYYEIPLDDLDPTKLLAYDPMDGPDRDDRYSPFDPLKMSEYAAFPKSAAEYYQYMWDKQIPRRQIMPYSRIIHILYKGTIDISHCSVIDLSKQCLSQ